MKPYLVSWLAFLVCLLSLFAVPSVAASVRYVNDLEVKTGVASFEGTVRKFGKINLHEKAGNWIESAVKNCSAIRNTIAYRGDLFSIGLDEDNQVVDFVVTLSHGKSLLKDTTSSAPALTSEVSTESVAIAHEIADLSKTIESTLTAQVENSEAIAEAKIVEATLLEQQLALQAELNERTVADLQEELGVERERNAQLSKTLVSQSKRLAKSAPQFAIKKPADLSLRQKYWDPVYNFFARCIQGVLDWPWKKISSIAFNIIRILFVFLVFLLIIRICINISRKGKGAPQKQETRAEGPPQSNLSVHDASPVSDRKVHIMTHPDVPRLPDDTDETYGNKIAAHVEEMLQKSRLGVPPTSTPARTSAKV